MNSILGFMGGGGEGGTADISGLTRALSEGSGITLTQTTNPDGTTNYTINSTTASVVITTDGTNDYQAISVEQDPTKTAIWRLSLPKETYEKITELANEKDSNEEAKLKTFLELLENDFVTKKQLEERLTSVVVDTSNLANKDLSNVNVGTSNKGTTLVVNEGGGISFAPPLASNSFIHRGQNEQILALNPSTGTAGKVDFNKMLTAGYYTFTGGFGGTRTVNGPISGSANQSGTLVVYNNPDGNLIYLTQTFYLNLGADSATYVRNGQKPAGTFIWDEWKIVTTNDKLDEKANKIETYTKTEVDNLIGNNELPLFVFEGNDIYDFLRNIDINLEVFYIQSKSSVWREYWDFDYIALAKRISDKEFQLQTNDYILTFKTEFNELFITPLKITGRVDLLENGTYTKTEVDTLLSNVEVDLTDYYNKTETKDLVNNTLVDLNLPEVLEIDDKDKFLEKIVEVYGDSTETKNYLLVNKVGGDGFVGLKSSLSIGGSLSDYTWFWDNSKIKVSKIPSSGNIIISVLDDPNGLVISVTSNVDTLSWTLFGNQNTDIPFSNLKNGDLLNKKQVNEATSKFDLPKLNVVKRYEYTNTSIVDMTKTNPFSIVDGTPILESKNKCSVEFSKDDGEIIITIDKTDEIEVLDLKLITTFTASSFNRTQTGNGRFKMDTTIKEFDSANVELFNEKFEQQQARNNLFANIGDTIKNVQLDNIKSFLVVTSNVEKTFVKIKVDWYQTADSSYGIKVEQADFILTMN